MSDLILVAAEVDGVNTRKDGSIVIRFATPEISPDAEVGLFRLRKKYCYLAIKAEEFGREEMDAISSMEAELGKPGKSDSQRLRDVLWLNWKNDNKGYPEFAGYYRVRMEQIINHYKGKLP